MNTYRDEQKRQNRAPRCENHPQREAVEPGGEASGPYCQECADAIEEGRL